VKRGFKNLSKAHLAQSIPLSQEREGHWFEPSSSILIRRDMIVDVSEIRARFAIPKEVREIMYRFL
ncbi:MAG: hypothetical protein SGI87_10385, partial [Flavobacteriales bacterium]|nr:hypothetical protein [Flavobacteriales bacterium]